MKTAFVCLAVLAMTVLGTLADDETYSGIAKVEGLGTIAFPVGKWSLETRVLRTASEALEKPDYFVFKKLDEPLGRLTFLRYNPLIAPKDAGALEETVQGFSRLSFATDGQKKMDWAEMGTRQILGTPTNVEWRTTASWLRIPPAPKPPWLYHAALYSAGQWAIGVIRAATAVTDPHTLENVYALSHFSRRVPEKMHLIPPELAGDWHPARENFHLTDIVHLGENGDCEIWSGSSADVMGSPSEGYYVPSDHLLVINRNRFRYDDKALTLTHVPEKGDFWMGAKVYKKSKPVVALPHGSTFGPRMINDGNTLKYEDMDMR